MKQPFGKIYNVTIATVPFPREPVERHQAVVDIFGPVINQMVKDALSVAVGTWPGPEDPDI